MGNTCPVPPGESTRHGQYSLSLMGALSGLLRQRFLQEGRRPTWHTELARCCAVRCTECVESRLLYTVDTSMPDITGAVGKQARRSGRQAATCIVDPATPKARPSRNMPALEAARTANTVASAFVCKWAWSVNAEVVRACSACSRATACDTMDIAYRRQPVRRCKELCMMCVVGIMHHASHHTVYAAQH
jgi:hypothetical protein